MARSMVRKDADSTAAMAFHFAATNWVELGVLLIVLLGWQFGIAEFIRGPIVIVLLMLTFRPTINTRRWLLSKPNARARRRALLSAERARLRRTAILFDRRRATRPAAACANPPHPNTLGRAECNRC
jgi:uncharacterized membrane protein YraQ (UPF0718 family)